MARGPRYLVEEVVFLFLHGKTNIVSSNKILDFCKLGLVSYQMPCALATFLEFLFVITEIRTADPLILLQVVTDGIATGSFVYKGIYARNNARSVSNF